ncbi:oligopeptidase A [Sulfuriflexus sp.]|uniref:oligopeptidase A n=1 Tax=Sulfuriflexus sp. TaxID=2015443 RepID=UPI0028CE854B|nr:oligopeptidase A [Sulfuriflexus sp.]MDT8405160.1 oligopeptidase A [Sulfuriflexus sp.]
MPNPLLEMKGLPPFSQIKPEHVEPAIDQLLAENRRRINDLLAANAVYTWDNLAAPIEAMEEQLSRTWSPVSHLNSVMNSDALREAYNKCLPKLSEYGTEMGQNEALFRAYQQLAGSEEYSRLDTARQKIIDNALRDFHLSGIALDDADKARFKKLKQELSTLTSKFEENVLDATHGWEKYIESEAQLAGLPESAIALARQNARQAGKAGWLFTLEFPSYYPIMTYADDAALREEMYQAYVTRASAHGPNAGKWDNAANMQKILKRRHQVAQLLGYKNYAERSLATKMASNPDAVLGFLNDLAERSVSMARAEFSELQEFAKAEFGVDRLNAWDIAYHSEKLRQQRYAITQEEVKPYFPEDRALEGLFIVINKLYGMQVSERHDVDTWHQDVRFFEIYDSQNELRGQFYLDLYARNKKRGGAWMDECIVRRRHEAGVQTPVAYLTCNFSPPVGDNPALFTHDEVITLFHEFGHGLQHMLTRIDYAGVAGINGVEWDAVELPSQFMENWCWQREALNLFARHYQTGEIMPEDLFNRMNAAKNFQSGMQMVRQLEFSLFDFRLHLEYSTEVETDIDKLLNEVREQVAVFSPPEYNSFANSFTHIFAGGYAAGYYSYKWAEVLSSDAFSAFEESGIFDRDTGLRFLHSVLEQGGSREAMDLFVEFRGREPDIDALLRHTGIAA